jgi:hypothetical protein
MLYHPVTLKLLYEWKMAREEMVPLDLMALLVDSRTSVDYEELHGLLYKYKKSRLRKKERIAALRSIIRDKFAFRENSDAGTEQGGPFCYLLTDMNEVCSEVRKLLKSTRKHRRAASRTISLPASEVDMPEMPSKKRQASTSINTLRFTKIDEKRERAACSTLGPFVPIVFDEDIVMCSSDPRAMKTVRMRRDIQDPKRLVFFKFHDRLRPPVYHFRPPRVRRRNSLRAIPEVLDYEEDSDWEDGEDAETIGSSGDDDDDVEESSQEWIDSDSGSVELTKSSKRPSLVFPAVKFNVVDEDEYWRSLPLTERDHLPQDCMDSLMKGLEEAEDVLAYARAFGRRHMIKFSVINRHLKKDASGH